jgi:hypothetical protein
MKQPMQVEGRLQMFYWGSEKRSALSEKLYLLSCKEMSSVNHAKLSRVFSETMQTQWPDYVKFDNVLLLVTDGGPYMKKRGEGLSVTYPKLIDTC